MAYASKLHWHTDDGEPIKVSRSEASTLTGFRRSAYAEPIKEILNKVLDNSRVRNETQPATEENRLRIAAVKEVMATLFDGKVELE